MWALVLASALAALSCSSDKDGSAKRQNDRWKRHFNDDKSSSDKSPSHKSKDHDSKKHEKTEGTATKGEKEPGPARATDAGADASNDAAVEVFTP